jgi:hypothetical protein
MESLENKVIIDDLPEEVLLVILIYCSDGSQIFDDGSDQIKEKIKLLMEVSEKWKSVIIRNFKYSLKDFFTESRTIEEYLVVFNGFKKYKSVVIKVIPGDRLQYTAFRIFMQIFPITEVRLDFADYNPDGVIDPYVFYSYMKRLENIEKLTLSFSFSADFLNKYEKLICKFKKLKSLVIFRGRNIEFFHAISAPKLTNLVASFSCIPKSMKDFMNLANRCKKLKNVQYSDTFEWYDQYLDLRLFRGAQEETEEFLRKRLSGVKRLYLFAERT